MKRIIATILLTCTLYTALAQHPIVRNFNKADYKAGAQNWCIQQDEAGNIWAANTGITMYDGLEWTLTETRNRSTVRSLLYDPAEYRMYFGAANEFGYLHRNSRGMVEYVALSDSISYTMEDIWAIHKIDDSIWLRESLCMYQFDNKDTKQYSFKDKVSQSAAINGELIVFVNNNGVFRYDFDLDSFAAMKGCERLKSERVVSILEHNGKTTFVCAAGDIYTWQEGELSSYNTKIDRELNEATIYCAATDGKHLALGTVRNGVYILEASTGHTLHLNTFSGLQNNTVLSMFYDKDGNLWLGLDKGIDMVMLSSPEYSLFGNPDFFGAGYASEIYNDRLWLGTNQGLYHTSEPVQDELSIRDEDIIAMPQIKGQVWSLMTYDGKLFCSHDRGISIIEGTDCTHIPLNGTWKLERLGNRPDYLLGSSYDSLFLLRKAENRWIFDGWVEGFEDGTKAFEEDSDGTIWFSHWIKGLYRLKLDIDSKRVTKIEFMSRHNGYPEDWSNVPIDLNNEIIFSTAKGFYGYDKYSERAYPLERLNSMFNTPPVSCGAYMSPQGYGYFSSKTMQAVYFKDKDGNDVVDSLSFKALAAKRLQGFEDIRHIKDDRILINTDEGFSILRMEKLKAHNAASGSRVYIKGIYSRSEEKEEEIYSSLGNRQDTSFVITLPYKSNSLQFNVAMPEYEQENNVRFSFMLENYDKGWSQYSERNRKEYTKLPHGKYTLRVRAEAELHSEVSESSIDIVIKAPWYFTRVAIAGYILAGILLSLLAYRGMYRFSMKRARLMALKKEEEMKKKQMKLDLERKAQDLAASTMDVIRKNEILLDIDADLEKVAENMSEDRNRSLKILGKIRHEIRDNIRHDDIWQKFEMNFDVVYNDYLKRLGEQYPQLTLTDKKMCAYLKMELSSKEIAPLLNITVRSVEMTRYRLRKKLGLSREDNLTEFLQNF